MHRSRVIDVVKLTVVTVALVATLLSAIRANAAAHDAALAARVAKDTAERLRRASISSCWRNVEDREVEVRVLMQAGLLDEAVDVERRMPRALRVTRARNDPEFTCDEAFK